MKHTPRKFPSTCGHIFFLFLLIGGSHVVHGQYFVPVNSNLNHLLYYLEDSGEFPKNITYSRPYSISVFDSIPDQRIRKYFLADSVMFRNETVVSAPSPDFSGTFDEYAFLNGQLTKNLYATFQMRLTNMADQRYVLGTSLSRFGMTGRIERGWITYQTKHLGLFAGRDALLWGPGRFSQLNINGDLPPYDMIRLRFSKYNFRLTAFTAFLPSVRSQFRPANYVNRYLTGRRLEYTAPGGRFTVGMGDAVLYTGENRPFSLAISNPFIPMYPLMFDDTERQTPEYQGDNENEQMFLDMSFLPLNSQRFYMELLVDEFQYDPKDRKRLDDATGITLGYGGVFPTRTDFSLHIQTEFTVLNTWVYNHPGQLTSWAYKDRPIGNKEGGDVRELHLRSDFWYQYKWSAGVQYDYIEKGEITPTDPWRPEETKQTKFPLGTVQYTFALTMDFYWYFWNLKYIRPYIQYEHITNYDHLSGEYRREWNGGLELFWWF